MNKPPSALSFVCWGVADAQTCESHCECTGLEEDSIICAAVQSIEEVLDDPQAAQAWVKTMKFVFQNEEFCSIKNDQLCRLTSLARTARQRTRAWPAVSSLY